MAFLSKDRVVLTLLAQAWGRGQYSEGKGARCLGKIEIYVHR